MVRILSYLAILLAVSVYCEAYKILIISSIPGRSHTILGHGLVKHITRAGHEVTYITSMPTNKPWPNVTEIDVGDQIRTFLNDVVNISKIMDKEFDLLNKGIIIKIMQNIIVMTLEHPNMQRLLNDPKERFDLIIAEWMFTNHYAGLPAIFNCPFIWLLTVEPHPMLLSIIDESPNPAYTTDFVSTNMPPFTFMERLEELMHQIDGAISQYLTHTENEDYERIIAPIARRMGKSVPSFPELKYNVSLVLGNSHVSLGQAVRLPQSYKPIGGYFIDTDVKPLPKDLQQIMDNAKNGIIYLSLGSNLKSKELPNKIKNDLLKMFGQLKQTIIWKFEEDLVNLPKNVHIVQWAPQPSILSHPNCILFITHGGFLSSTETVHFGVPIIGIPVYGDQFNNIDRAVYKGYAKRVDLSYSLADDLKLAITDILSDHKYTNKVKELSFIYHDRPVSPGDELVHWVEHVIRTRGALHLRSPALYVPWYQKMYLDLVAVIVLSLITLRVILKRLLATIWPSKPDSEKKRK